MNVHCEDVRRNVSYVKVDKRKLQESYHELFSMATETRNINNRYELQLLGFDLNIRAKFLIVRSIKLLDCSSSLEMFKKKPAICHE